MRGLNSRLAALLDEENCTDANRLGTLPNLRAERWDLTRV
jgi:hypothetical protein